MKTLSDLPLGTIPIELLPVSAAPFAETTGPVVSKMPELEELRKLAAEEDELLELQKKFSEPAAREEHERRLDEAVHTKNPAKIRAVGSEAEFVSVYNAGFRNLSKKILEIHAKALPALEAVTAEVATILFKMREDAVSDFAQVFSSRGLPVPSASVVSDHYTRALQELIENIRRERDTNLRGHRLSKFLGIVGA